MADIYILERKDGYDLSDYTKRIPVEKVDTENCVLIELINNDKLYRVAIPTELFSDFVIECQKMKATLCP